MIVEPVPTNPRSPLRRLLRIAGVASPLVALVGVVTLGALGPPTAGVPPDASLEPTSTVAARTTDRAPANRVDDMDGSFPTTWIGLRVASPGGTLADRDGGRAVGILAVAGYLRYGSLPWSCTDAYLERDRTGCEGRAVLTGTAVPATDGVGGGAGRLGPHLHPVFPPGTRGPAPSDTTASGSREAIPVVLLGRLGDALACPPDAVGCRQSFTVERVVWVAGAPWPSMVTVDPAVDVDPATPEVASTVEAAHAALGRGALPLAASIVRPDVLAVIDEEAAAALEQIPDGLRVRPITYARALMFQFDASQPLYGRDPAIGWVVLDSITGEVLARSGPASEPYGSAVIESDPTPRP